MSSRQVPMIGVKFEPVPKNLPQAPSELIVLFGVIYPTAVILIEFFTHICGRAFFDPMPTYGHVAAVAFVPASNLFIWKLLQAHTQQHARWLALVNGASMAIAGLYAILFLPMLPFAIVGIAFGLGILPLAPPVAFVSVLILRRAIARRQSNSSLLGPMLAGLTAGVAVMIVLDIPGAATRLGAQWAASNDPPQRERGLTLLRTLGDDDLLLRLCYDAAGRSTGLLGALFVFGENIFEPQQRRVAVSSAQAREIYYRLHGIPFNAKPAPLAYGNWSRFGEFQFDNDLGGAEVGGRLKGLEIASSRLDGSVSGDDAVAYLEWTVEFHNSAPIEQEVRLQLALPQGGVVSRATLWVNGEVREAAFGGRADVRAAYQRVAVQQRRDPLLVTTKGADRVLVQAFPVPRNGGLIKFKLGITAPLEILESSKARLTLPALLDRNFSFGPYIRHSVWVESRQPLAASIPGLTGSRTDARLFRISGEVSDRDLSRTRQIITVDRNPDAGRLVAHLGDGQPVVQQIMVSAAPAMKSLMLVVDGSARLADARGELVRALNGIPDGISVGVIIASEPPQRLPLAPWTGEQRQRAMALLRSTSFSGGQDNAPALTEALTRLEAQPDATLLWIHGPQPVTFHESAAGLEQATARLKQMPQVVLYAVEPGPNKLLPDASWVWTAHSLPQTGSIDSDLAAFFARASDPARTLVVQRTVDQPADGLPRGSDHIARLWANDRVLELMRSDPVANRAAALELATMYRLVTPVSGAVVLETNQQYQENRIAPMSQVTVPTVPEPREWALILMAGASLAWLIHRSRQRLVRV